MASGIDKPVSETLRLWDFSSDVGLALVSSDSIDAMLQRCADLMVSFLGAAFARIWTVDSNSDFLELKASAGLYTHLDGAHARVPVGALKIGRIAAERVPHLTNDVPNDARVSDQDWARREGMIAFAGYPLLAGEKLIGVVAMFARQKLSDNVLDALGSVAAAIAIGIERRRTEETLRNSQRQLQVIAESASDGIVVIDGNSRIMFCNQALAGLFGYERDHLLGQNLTILMPAEMRDRHIAGFTRYLETRERRLNWARIELRARHSSGREFPIEVSFGEAESDGQLVFTGVIRDVTERKLQDTVARLVNESATVEQALQATLEAICRALGYDAAVAWQADDEQHKLELQAAWAADAALAPFIDASRVRSFRYGEGLPGTVLGRNELIFRKDIGRSINFPRADAARQAGIKTGFGLPIRAQESIVGVAEFFTRTTITIRDDTARLLTALFDRVGQFSARSRAQQALEKQAHELQRSNSDLRQFAAIAAHEIAQPLDNITQQLKKLQRELKAGENSRHIAASLETIAFINRTLNDLIAYSEMDRSEDGELKVVSLNTVLQWVKISLHTLIQNELAVITEDPLPDVFGNESRLKRLFQKLIENAVRFHRDGPPRIHVSASREPNEWIFCVKDNGAGIPADELPHIFDFQHRGAPGHDSGIGLAICRRIVERMGGRIWATSEPGRGSEFCFTMPRNAGPA